MGELTTIGYRPGRSPLHRLDPRTKQLLLIGIGVASIGGDVTFLTLSSMISMILFNAADLKMRRLIYEIRYFLWILSALFILRSLTVTAAWPPVAASPRAVADALIVCWRLLLVVGMGLLLMSTTRIGDIRAALIWFLRPVPGINEKMTATMVGLLVRFLPLILLQAGETNDALRARGIEKRKNPFIRLVRFAVALFRRVFLRADALIDSMQARCYNERRTAAELSFSRRDGLAMGIGALLCLTALLP